MNIILFLRKLCHSQWLNTEYSIFFLRWSSSSCRCVHRSRNVTHKQTHSRYTISACICLFYYILFSENIIIRIFCIIVAIWNYTVHIAFGYLVRALALVSKSYTIPYMHIAKWVRTYMDLSLPPPPPPPCVWRDANTRALRRRNCGRHGIEDCSGRHDNGRVYAHVVVLPHFISLNQM